MNRQIRNLGFSLVELIVAFAILGTATLGIGSLYVAATRSSAGVNRESELQNEAQLVTNQLEKMVISTDLGLNYRVTTADGDRFVLSDEDVDTQITSKVLYIFNSNENAEMEVLLLKWDESHNIYYKKLSQASMDGKHSVRDIDIETGTWELLAEYVESFSIKLEEKGDKAELFLRFANGRDNVDVDKTLRLRNAIFINVENLSDISEKINVAVEAEITGVAIQVTPSLITEGKGAQLRWEVKGKGTFAQNITSWRLSTTSDMENLISAENVSVTSDGILNVDLSKVDVNGTEVESLRGSIFLQALVDTGEKDEYNNVIYVESNIEELKIIEDMQLKLQVEEGEAPMVGLISGTQKEAYDARTGMTYYFSTDVIGVSLDASEKRVVWSLANVNGVEATISSDGVVEIDKYSPNGSFDVVAALAKRTDIQLHFPMQVGDGHTASDKLVVSGSGIINRGGEEAYVAKLKGKTIDPEDCIWSVTVPGSWDDEAASAVRIGTTGIVTVKDTLDYDLEGEIIVDAKLKTNQALASTPANVKLQKVSIIKIKPTDEISATRGEKVNFVCQVQGIEDYTLDWHAARSLDTDHYFTARGNTYITGYEKDGLHYAELLIGSDEPAEMLWLEARAQIGGSDVATSWQVDTRAEITISITQNGKSIATDGSGKVVKSGKYWFNENWIYIDASIVNGDDAKLKWIITQGTTRISASEDFFGQTSFKLTKSGTVTIRAEYEGYGTILYKEVTVKTN